MKSNSLIVNPFTIYSIAWIIVIVIYSFGWSNLYPKLSVEYIIFLTATIIISFILGIYTYNKKIFSFNLNAKTNYKGCRRIIFIIIFLFLIECLFARSIPILASLSETKDVTYTEFGLPIIHVLVVNGISLCCLYSYYGYLNTDNKYDKKNHLKNVLLSLIPFFLMFNRGATMICITGCVFLYLMKAKSLKKVFTKLLIFAFSILFIFGWLGNLRSSTDGSSNLILQVGQATESFKESPIPHEFFWSYIYISSPLANAQNIVNKNKNIQLDTNSLLKFFIYEQCPQIISKRLETGISISQKKPNLIVDQLTVCSVYGKGYQYIGWGGPILMFIFMIIFTLFNILLIHKKSIYHTLCVAFLCALNLMNIFDNMFIFMGVVPQVLILILISRLKISWNGKNIANILHI